MSENETKGQPDNLRIMRAENGGWMVETCANHPMMNARLVACYTTHSDLIKGLDELLRPAAKSNPYANGFTPPAIKADQGPEHIDGRR